MLRVLARLAFAAALVLVSLGSVISSPLVAAAPTPCADLQIVSISFSPTTPIEGQNATITIVVKNAGTCTAVPAFVVQWKLDQLSPTGPSQQVPGGLIAGATATVQLSYAFPRAGNFQSQVQVDTDNSVKETNEVNNLQIAPVTVLAAEVDLTITSFTVLPASPVPGTYQNPVAGRVAHASITVHNQGNTAAGAFIVSWKPQVIGTTLSLQVDGLGANQTTTIGFDYTYPWPNNHVSVATVDSTNRVKETDETNNTATATLTVDPQLPDLVITNVAFNPTPPIAGSVVTATVTIANKGHAGAGAFQVEWAPNNLVRPLSRQVNSLAEGATTTVSFDYTYQFSFSYNSTFTVDSLKRVWEMNEDNNEFDVQVPVGRATVDLTITNLSITPSNPSLGLAQGSPATFNLTIKNNGNSPAGNFVVSLNPDTFGLIVPGAATLTQQIFGLGAGQSRTLSIPFTYTAYGNFRVLAKVDAFNNVIETNEANNEMIIYPEVSPAPIDLQITSFSIDPFPVTRASKATATITVKNVTTNNDPWTANNFAIQWRLKDTDTTGPTVWVDGLRPGESTTVTLDGVFYTAGGFTSEAIVDVYNTVPEPCAGCEANNVRSIATTVNPRKTTLKVTVNSMKVYNDLDDGLAGSGEWNMYLALLDPSSSCSAFGQTIDKIQCAGFYFEPDTSDGTTTNGIGTSLTVTLIESTPLVIGIAGYESDAISDHGLVPSDNPGYALGTWFSASYLTLGTFDMQGQKGDSRCSNGECFDANITVSVISQPPPPANGLAASSSDETLSPTDQDTVNQFLTTSGQPEQQ